MTFFEWVRRQPVSSTLFMILTLFFLGASVVSASTYASVVRAQQDIVLENPSKGMNVLANGSLEFTLSIDFVNPSRYPLHLYSGDWIVRVVNDSGSGLSYIPLVSEYTSWSAGITIPARDRTTFSYLAVVSDPGLISRVNGFANYSVATGQEYTLETVPYEYNLDMIAFLGEFKHDYLREFYLNDMVQVERTYNSKGAVP